MNWLLDPLQYAFMQRGLLAALMVGVLCSVVGSYVVLRSMAFLGDAMAHAVLPGVAIAYLLGGNLLFGALAAAVVVALGIGFFSRKGAIQEDTAIGILFTAALALGIAPQAIAAGVAAFAGVLGRMERMDRGQPFLAIVDFAHSPASLERALKTLRPLVGTGATGAPGRLIAVFGSAGLRDRAKRRWMGQISGRLADYTIITAEDPRTEDVLDICAEIEAGVRESVDANHYRVIADRTEAIHAAIAMAQPGDIVAAFGKGHERSMCYGVIEHPWSDQAAMLAALDALDARR